MLSVHGFAANANKVVDRVMAGRSKYSSIEEGVRKRAHASQNNPTDTEDFCRILIDRLESEKAPKVIRIANGSTAYPLIKRWVPTAFLEKILMKMFMLDKLKPE